MSLGDLISKGLSYIEPTLGDREQEYRLSFLKTDKKRFCQGLALGSLLVLAFFLSDYIFFGISRQFWVLFASRLFFVAAVITFITFSDKLKTPEQLDWAAFAAALTGAVLLLYSTGLAHGVERGAVDRHKLLLALPWEFDLPCLSGIRDYYREHGDLP